MQWFARKIGLGAFHSDIRRLAGSSGRSPEVWRPIRNQSTLGRYFGNSHINSPLEAHEGLLWARFKPKKRPKGFKFVSAQGLGKAVGDLFVGGNVLEIHIAIRYLAAHPMVLNIDVLDTAMVLRILG